MTQPEEHCRSYYAATVNDTTTYPVLQGRVESDVCVIGAGFTGVNTALELVERGYSVTLIESSRVGWGASGRNGGQLIHGISGSERMVKVNGPESADIIADMEWRGNKIVRDRIKKFDIDCDFHDGYIDVALKSRHMDEFKQSYDEIKKRNLPYDVRMVDAEETHSLLGTKEYIGGLLNMENGHLHPLNLCLGEAKAASSLGVKIFEQSPVIRIEHGPKPIVHTEKGHVQCQFVVLSGNSYHELEQSRLGGILFPAGSYIIATEPLSDDMIAKINPKRLAVCDPNYVLDYFRVSADNRMLFGGRCNYSGRDPKSITATLMPRMLVLYPELADARIDYEWGGRIGVVVNRVPMLGRLESNVFYSQGYSGHGVNFSHIAAEVIADAVGGTLERLDLFEKVNHFRIPGGQWFGNQLVALGMIYYRMRDIL